MSSAVAQNRNKMALGLVRYILSSSEVDQEPLLLADDDLNARDTQIVGV